MEVKLGPLLFLVSVGVAMFRLLSLLESVVDQQIERGLGTK